METPYYNPAFERSVAQNGTTPEAYDRAKTELLELLSSPELASEIASGNVTVAMIRPSLEGALMEDRLDEQAAALIEENIMNLGVLAKFSVQFDSAAIEEFYGGTPKEVQLGLPPERYPDFSNRWDEFVDLMGSGQTTVLLLHTPNGDAISLWREQVGHYDIVNRRDHSTIRGRFGADNYNNLIHGSDSPVSAGREVSILRDLLSRSG